MMNEEFKNKIIEQINKSGFPLELELIEKLRSSGNLVFSNISFQTLDNSIKELDIVSLIQSERNDWSMGPCAISLIIECKKSTKYPWVFFEEIHDPLNNLGLLSKADYSSDFFDKNGLLNPLTGCMNTVLTSHHYNMHSIPTSRTYFELGKQDNEPTAIFKSVMNLFHGRSFLNQWFVGSGRSNKSIARIQLNQYAIVFDGELILATKDGNDFIIDNANHIILTAIDTIAIPADGLTGNEILIDVVTKDYFDEYLKILIREARDFGKHLSQIYESGLITPSQRVNQ